MKVKITFTEEEGILLKNGYERIQHRKLDDEQVTIRYDSIAEYLKAGKKAQRQRAVSEFLQEYGMLLIGIVIMAVIIIWSVYPHPQKTSEYEDSTSHSSTSGIYQSDTCSITTCNDGSCSSSTGRGTCSHHGGVRD